MAPRRLSAGEARHEFIDDWLLRRKLLAPRRAANAKRFPNLAVFAFDTVSAEVMSSGIFERDILELTFEFLADKRPHLGQSCALDIGANVGNHAIYFAGRFAHVYAIEASERPFKLLQVNADLYGEGRVTPILAAVSDVAEELEFVEKPGEVGSSHFNRHGPQGEAGQLVYLETVVGDDLVDQLAPAFPIGLIKIDVEGFESEVLRGLQRTIGKFKPVILIEQLANEIRDGSTEALDFLRDRLGYRSFFHVEVKRPTPIRRLNLALRLTLGSELAVEPIERLDPNTHYPMLICVPGSD